MAEMPPGQHIYIPCAPWGTDVSHHLSVGRDGLQRNSRVLGERLRLGFWGLCGE